MFYSGGARKKNTVQEIFKFDPEKIEDPLNPVDNLAAVPTTSYIEEEEPEIRSDTESIETDDDSETGASDGNNAIIETNNDANYANYADNNDYIVTVSTTDTTGQHYHYAFTEEELDYDLEDFVEAHPEIKKYQLVIYKINTYSSLPFLEFLFYYDKSEHAKCHLPYYQHKPKHHIRKETDNIMNKLFKGKYKFNGFFHDTVTNECFIFYEKYFVYEPIHEKTVLQHQPNHWFWVSTSEIIYHRKYLMLPIDDDVVDFFIAYPTVGILQATIEMNDRLLNRFQRVNIEAPTILYYGSEICYAKNTAIYGMKREPIISRYGPFYYFTTFEHSFYWACYVKSRNKIKRRETSNGGISRYAVFTKKMKTSFIDDDYDVEVVKKYRERKSVFETNTPHVQQSHDEHHPSKLFDSVYAYDYDWTIDYDTIYNGYYNIKNEILRPIWCVYEHHNFQLLSYYEVDVDKCPEHYDPEFLEYKIK